jgi:L-lactate dehydrogenase complex protein LldE
MVTVLERLGVRCQIPEGQTCCGQPFHNSGFPELARRPASQWLKAFGRTQGYIVAPSASCVGYVRRRYPELFPAGTPEHAMAMEAVGRTFEFIEFLTHVLQITDVGAYYPYRVTYHASCHLLRELGLRDEPKRLLQAVKGLEFVPLPAEETCCGFGGVFSVVLPEVSRDMMGAKVRSISSSGAQVVAVAETGCLMNISGGLAITRSPVRACHLIQILAHENRQCTVRPRER